jgi:exosortase/archaeosortase family protein
VNKMLRLLRAWPQMAGLAVFGGCLGIAEVFPFLRLEAFCRPAAILASIFLGCPVEEAESGYVLFHPQREVRVIEACSGFDFFALLYAVLVTSACKYGGRCRWSALGLMPLAYAITLAANAARIVCAFCARMATELLPVGLPDESVHLAVGAGIFATFLVACCQAARAYYEHIAPRSRAFPG